ncbi:MAG TPA: hypothetical protein VII58_03595 [Acidobacteriaceae bacterium]
MRMRRAIAIAAMIASSISSSAGGSQGPRPDAAGANSAVTQAVPMIVFDFVRNVPGAPVPKYTLRVRNDGAASYEGEALPERTRYGAAATPEAIPFHRDMSLTPAATTRIFDLAAQLDHFNRRCASKAKNIADTGTKTISYTGPDGSGSCTYNFTEVKELAALTELIQGITQTLDAGRELDRLHRYDRLGLDSAMTWLQQEAAAGRAVELQTIGESLRSIAGDSDLLARVRAKASALLTQTGAAK